MVSYDGVKMDGTVICKRGYLLKGINTQTAEVRCKSRSGSRPRWVLEDGEDLPNCLKACTSNYDCADGTACEVATQTTSLCQPQYCYMDDLVVLNGNAEFPIQSAVTNVTLMPVGYVGQVTCDEHFILDLGEVVTPQISIICAKDNVCGINKWTTLSGGKQYKQSLALDDWEVK